MTSLYFQPLHSGNIDPVLTNCKMRNTLQSWYENRGEITVDVFLEKCKDLYKEN